MHADKTMAIRDICATLYIATSGHHRANGLTVKIAQFSPGTLICRELPRDGILERLLEARHRVHNFVVAGHYVIAQASLHRLLAWSLGITFVFGLYFALVEINERMDEGELWTLFFDSPNSADDSRRHLKITVGNGRS
jgi:hypothetical protein